MSRRILLSLVLTAAFAPVPAATAAPAVPTLAGTVRITATASGVIDVRLPKVVDFGGGHIEPPGTQIIGDGRNVGAMLLHPEGKLPGFEVVRYGFCREPGCDPRQHRIGFYAYDDRTETGHERMPAGVYRLVVFTDGKPITVILKFPGLKGSISLKPKRPVMVTHQTPTYFGSTGGVVPETAYTGSVPVNVDGGLGVLFHQFFASTDVSAQQAGAFCFYSGLVAAEPAPGCPGGNGNEISKTEVKPEEGMWAMTGRRRFVSPGQYRAGSYYRTVGWARDPGGTVTTVTIPPQ